MVEEENELMELLREELTVQSIPRSTIKRLLPDGDIEVTAQDWKSDMPKPQAIKPDCYYDARQVGAILGFKYDAALARLKKMKGAAVDLGITPEQRYRRRRATWRVSGLELMKYLEGHKVK